MRKFLEEFNDKSVEDLKQAFPSYSNLFDEVQKLEKSVKGDVSTQVSDEFETLINSLDNFLFKEENLKILGVAQRVEKEKEISQEEAVSKLEKEIEELTQNIDSSLIDQQVKEDIEKTRKSRISAEDLEVITRDMLDKDQQYYGIKFTQTEFKEGNFNRVLSMLDAGCQFYTGKYADLTYIMFKLNATDRLIVEKKNPIIKYENIFGGQSTPLGVYVLSKEKKNLGTTYKIVNHAFVEGIEAASVNDKDLFNAPYFVGAYSDIFYEKADLLLQSDYILNRSDNIKQTFALHFPLQYILTITFCKAIYDKQSEEGQKTYEQIADLIRENIRTKTFRIEGIGEVPHEPDVLEKLQSLNYLDVNLNLTGISNDLMFYTGQAQSSIGFSVNQKFNAFSYYLEDLKQKFTSSKNKFYSEFNGSPVFHTGENMSKIDYALSLSTKKQNEFGFKNATQKSAFPTEWQATQNFKDFAEYIPFSSSSNLKFFPRTSEAELRGLQDIMNFKDDERYDMYFACKDNPLYTFAFNSFVYNGMLKLYDTKKTKLLGPKITASSIKKPIYFMLVDEKNSLLAVIKPLYSQEKVYGDDVIVEKGQLDMFVRSNYFSLSTNRNPSAIWDFENLMEQIKMVAPEEVETGVLVSDAGNLTNESEIEEAKEQVETPDLTEEEILDADAYDSPEEIVVSEETEQEMTLEDMITVMEEHLATMPEDEDVREELDKLKEELLATKKQKSIEEEQQEIEEQIEEEEEIKEEIQETEAIEPEEIEEEDYDDIIDDEEISEPTIIDEEDIDYDDLFDID